MTDSAPQDGTVIKDQVPGTPVIPTTPSSPATPAEEAWWTEASSKHGFKSKEDVYKSWSEAQRKISEDGEKLKNFQIFQDNVVPVLDVVLKDEEILGKVKSKMENPSTLTPTAPKVEENKGDTEARKFIINDIASSFEKKYGIDKLDEETQKDIKAKVGLELKKFTSLENPDINKLPTQFDDAFALAIAKDDKLKSVFTVKEEGLGDYGIPSQASAVDKDGNIKLTPEQEKVAEQMPGGREAYIKGLKKLQAK